MRHEHRIKRFWSHIDRKHWKQCWNWTGYKDKYGYGRTTWKWRDMLSHRIAWMLHNHRSPGNRFVCHSCDNPSCCNPHHLFLGTRQDNIDDCVSKGRNGCKLNPDKARKIRKMYSSRRFTQTQIANRFGVVNSMISHVINNIAWKTNKQ